MSDTATSADKMTEMVATMSPVLQPGTFVFCTMFSNSHASDAMRAARVIIHEDEGTSLILPRSEAVRFGMIFDATYSQITLMVYSSLEAVGLSAAVASALAQHGIACNIVAGTQHDHLFVPQRRAEEAMEVLKALQAEAQAHMP